MSELGHIAHLLNDTLSYDGNTVRSATESLDHLSLSSHSQFPHYLLSIATGGENLGLRIAAATYLKNFTRRNVDFAGDSASKVSKEFKDQLMHALLRVEPEILKVLVEAFRIIVKVEFAQQYSWPELVPELCLALQNSDLISNEVNHEWKTVNALTILHSLIRPFQYFLNPKVAVEPVPPQLELITNDILVPLLIIFHNLVEKVKVANDVQEMDTEKMLLIICKCIHLAVKSHMPSGLAPHVASFSHDLIGILDSLSFDSMLPLVDWLSFRLKAAKRSLLIFCALVTRHRKQSDKLMPDIIKCVLRIVKFSSNVSKLDFLSERVISLAFDVISHVLETGPGWRLVSPHFSSLLDSAIMPALTMNEKDITEWEEDPDEYIRRNLPSDLEEATGWREDSFTARKSAINLLGVISMSRGPPIGISCNSSTSSKRKKSERNKKSQNPCMGELLVLPFLSKFPIPTDSNASQATVLNNYFGVLMAYGGLQDFLNEQKAGYTANLLRTRVLPVYGISEQLPYLVATANWVMGEFASCLPEEMSSDVYSSLMKALVMADTMDTSCHPVRVSAAGAIAKLLENDYHPPEWQPLLQVIIGRIGIEDEESCILLQLLGSLMEAGTESLAALIPDILPSVADSVSKFLPSIVDEPWPQVVEQGFATLALMAQSWESYIAEEAGENESNEKLALGRTTISRAFSALLQESWLKPGRVEESEISIPPSCIDDSSTLLRFIMLSVTESTVIVELKVSELLSVWSDLISDWHAWEESEDLSVFDCIKEAVRLCSMYKVYNFITRDMPSPPAPPVPQGSIIEGIGAFISEAIAQYPSATWRACLCSHMLLHIPNYPPETEGVKHSLAIAFTRAAFSRFREIHLKPSSMWKPILLVISSCFLYYPNVVEEILEEDKGFTVWVSALCSVTSSNFEHNVSGTLETKLCVMTLIKLIERLVERGRHHDDLMHDCVTSLIEAIVQLKKLEEGSEEDDDDDDDDGEREDDADEECDDEDSEVDEHEETQEEFLERYAKAAADLENGLIVEEGDLEEQEHEPELGRLEDVDLQTVVFSTLEKYQGVLVHGQVFPTKLISDFKNVFPEKTFLIQQ